MATAIAQEHAESTALAVRDARLKVDDVGVGRGQQGDLDCRGVVCVAQAIHAESRMDAVKLRMISISPGYAPPEQVGGKNLLFPPGSAYTGG